MEQSTMERKQDRRILLACIGNIFLGDDGFGVEVARQLEQRGSPYPAQVRVVDFGIRGLDLAFELLEEYTTLILVDTIQRGGQPGTLYLLEPDVSEFTPQSGEIAGRVALDAHSMDPYKVLAFACSLGARPIQTFLVGCEPANLANAEADEMSMGLSEPVQSALPGALSLLDALIARLLASSVAETPA